MERALMRCCDVHSASRRVRISAQRTGYSILCRCMYTYRSIITCNLIDCCYSLRQKRAKKSSILFSDKTSAGKTNDKMKQVAKAPFVVGECSLSSSLIISLLLSLASTNLPPFSQFPSISFSHTLFLSVSLAFVLLVGLPTKMPHKMHCTTINAKYCISNSSLPGLAARMPIVSNY